MLNMLNLDPLFWASVLQIIWIDVLLSGDNAVVIALACQSLPQAQRRIGIALGVAGALIIRIAFAGFISLLLGVPMLKILGAVALVYIATKLMVAADEDGPSIKTAGSLRSAVILIIAADVTMSLDNVVAIAGASRGHAELFAFGLLLSMPLMIVGASLISRLMAAFPVLIVAGAALLGWIAGEMGATDPYVVSKIQTWGFDENAMRIGAGLVCIFGVLIMGTLWRQRLRSSGD